MYAKQIKVGLYAIFSDEKCENYLGTCEFIRSEWFFQARGSLGRFYSFGASPVDAVELSGVLAQVQKRGVEQ